MTWAEYQLDGIGQVASEIVEALRPHDRIHLVGEVGAGKTTLVRALVGALGGDARQVSSPTWGLCHEYSLNQGTMLHIDWYRGAHDRFEDFDLDITQAATYVCVEWPESGPDHIHSPTLDIRMVLSDKGGEFRKIQIQRPDGGL